MRNMQQMMMQAKAMQKKMEQIQANLANEKFDAQAGGGMVKAIVTGKQELVDVTIDPEAMKDADAETLSEMVKIAVNEALKKSQEHANKAMGGALGGLPLPPGLF